MIAPVSEDEGVRLYEVPLTTAEILAVSEALDHLPVRPGTRVTDESALRSARAALRLVLVFDEYQQAREAVGS